MDNGDLELGDVDKIREGAQSLLDHCARNRESHMNQVSPSIYMVPSVLRDLSPSSFNPRLVSIGPLHRKDENVQAFEKQKGTYLIKLMSRINSPEEEILKSCMQKAYTFMNEIKACYVSTAPYKDAEIAKIMVMDACFILEFLIQISETFFKSYSGKLQLQTIVHDLLLLENQIPLFFLDKIFQCTVSKFESEISLIDLISVVLHSHNIFESYIETDNVSIDTTHHILSLLHECYKPQYNIIPIHFVSTIIPSAVDLDMRGVNFKPNHYSTWTLGMEVKLDKFLWVFGCWSTPTLRMPELHVDNSTEMVLRNLIAYEQSFEAHNHIISYVVAMDMLVNTQEDVAKLVDSKVLFNHMDTNEEVADMINKIGKDVITSTDFFYEHQWKILNKHCNSNWSKHIAYWSKNMRYMRSTYFSPWNLIALIAGIILFALTIVQTIFTVKSAGSNK